jgi:hypothetical protein
MLYDYSIRDTVIGDNEMIKRKIFSFTLDKSIPFQDLHYYLYDYKININFGISMETMLFLSSKYLQAKVNKE